MTDNQANQAPLALAEQPLVAESAARFAQGVAELAGRIPEVAIKQEALRDSGEEIIDQFDIQPSLFEDQARTLVFTAITSRWADNKNREGEGAEKEQRFLYDSLALLAYAHSPKLAELKPIIEGETSKLSDDEKMRIYDRYTDQTLSREMAQAISGGLLGEAKKRLGVTDANEDPYEVRVLSIDPKKQTSLGLHTTITNWDELPGDHEEKLKRFREESALLRAVQDQQQGLELRAEKMADELGEEVLFAPAWVTHANGKTLLCITMPTAEKILNPELTANSRNYTQDYWKRDFAFLEHEYTHTQGGLNLDQGVSFGINMEEFRAELFSGNKHGYHDIKGLFQDVKSVTGFSLGEFLAQIPKGGSAESVYEEVARQLGLSPALELLLAAPANYFSEQSNPFHREIFNHLGGYDGITGRLLQQQIAAGKGEQIDARIADRAKHILSITKDYEGIINSKKRSGLNVVSNLISQKLKMMDNDARES
jgi:hypothetical protein